MWVPEQRAASNVIEALIIRDRLVDNSLEERTEEQSLSLSSNSIYYLF
jgi:hypothetical protein